jgi:hypothetical protein
MISHWPFALYVKLCATQLAEDVWIFPELN